MNFTDCLKLKNAKSWSYSFPFSCLFLFLSLVFSCRKDPIPPNPNEEELITTMQIIFSDSAGIHPSKSFSFRDPDGPGGFPPIQFDTIVLNANTSWNAELLLLDESGLEVDTISNEVRTEANDHLFLFEFVTVPVTVSYLDFDSHIPPLPLGLLSRWRIGNSSTGTAKISLKHQPGVKDGTAAPGETDVEVLFQFHIL